MKKSLSIVCTLTILLFASASCDNGQNPAVSTTENVTIIDDPSQLSSRLVFGGSLKKLPARKRVATTPAPAIPADALPLKDAPTNWNNGVTLTKGKSYYINEPWTGTISQDWSGEGSIDI